MSHQLLRLTLVLTLACGEAKQPDPTDSFEGESESESESDTDTDTDTDTDCTEDAELALYDRYIEPLMTDAHSSNCNACHLSGIDLQMYIQDTPCQSMACMTDLGVVDLGEPASSRILDFIREGDPASPLIDGDVMDREYDGFLEWIEWSAVCHDEVCGEIDDACSSGTADTTVPDGVISPTGGCTEAELVSSFQHLVMPHHGRCTACHWENGSARDDFESAPLLFWYSSDDSAHNAMMSMYNFIGRGVMDVDSPAESTLITKPLEVGTITDSDLGPVTGVWHGGGPKIHGAGDGEAAFADFVDWIEVYTACRGESPE